MSDKSILKKGLLIYPINTNNTSIIGLIKKSVSQSKSFTKHVDADTFFFTETGAYLNGALFEKFPISINFLTFLNYYFWFYQIVLKQVRTKSYDFIYIRYPLSNPFFIRFLRLCKSHSNRIRIFIEIPTYPYENEFNTLKRQLLGYMDWLSRNYLRRYVERIITHYGQKEIFGIPCYLMGNGVEELPRKKSLTQDVSKINLLGVANLSYYHGYDRLIVGLKEYYNLKSESHPLVHFDILGSGPEINKLKDLVNKSSLDKYVKFQDVVQGDELMKYFDKADIGVSTLGWHRSNVFFDGSLKSREYAMRGLPFITCATDQDFEKAEFNFVVGLNEEPVDIFMVINFVEKCKSKDEFSVEIRDFAMSNLTWDVKIKKFIDAFFQT